MKVYIDCELNTGFFKTDKYIKNLKEIEINSIHDFVWEYSLDPLILLGINSWMVGRFDELTSGNPTVDLSDEPELHGEWLDIDFVEDMSNLDILVEINKWVVLEESDIEAMLPLFDVLINDYVGEDEQKRWVLGSSITLMSLEVIMNQDGGVDMRFVHGTL